MKTVDIIANFLKGFDVANISEKQKAWLLGQAKKEGIQVRNDGFNDCIYFDDCFYKIKQCKRLASGGSYVGTRLIQGQYRIERMFAIEFTATGLTSVYNNVMLSGFKKEGHSFKIIPAISL
jgi:hypothetical protein